MLLQTKYVFFIFLEPKHFKLTQSDVVTGERRDGEPPPSETAAIRELQHSLQSYSEMRQGTLIAL